MEILEYGVKLVDNMSPAAKQAQDSVNSLSRQLRQSKIELRDYEAELKKAKLSGDAGAYTKFEGLVSGAREKTMGLSDALGGMREHAADAAKGQELLASSVKATAGVYLAAATSAVALGASLAALTFEAAKFGIEASEEKDQLLTMFDALGDGPGAGQATIDMLDDLEGSLGQTRKKLSEWTQEYEALGITDLGGLRYQLDATGASYAIMGDKGASAYEHLEAKIQEAIETGHGIKIADKGLAALAQTGANVTDVAAKMGVTAAELRDELKKGSVDAQAFGDALSAAIIEKGQGPLENLRTDIGTITAQGEESFKKLFEGVDAEPFKLELADTVGLMKEGVPSADALKWGITTFLDKVYEVGAEALPVIKHFFLETEILALQSYIALYPTIAAFEDLNDSLGPVGLSVHNIDLYFRGLITSLQLTTQLVGALLPGMIKVGTLGLVSPKTGDQTAQGFVDGIRGQKEKAGAAGSDLAGAADDGASKRLEIKSPSRVGMRIGDHFGGGIAFGVRESAHAVARASEHVGERAAEAPRMGFAPIAAAAASSSARAPSYEPESPYASHGGGGAMVVHVGGLHFHGGSQESVKDMTETAVVTLFERIALQVGR